MFWLEPAERRADQEDHDRGLEHELAAVEVAELPVERPDDRRGRAGTRSPPTRGARSRRGRRRSSAARSRRSSGRATRAAARASARRRSGGCAAAAGSRGDPRRWKRRGARDRLSSSLSGERTTPAAWRPPAAGRRARSRGAAATRSGDAGRGIEHGTERPERSERSPTVSRPGGALLAAARDHCSSSRRIVAALGVRRQPGGGGRRRAAGGARLQPEHALEVRAQAASRRPPRRPPPRPRRPLVECPRRPPRRAPRARESAARACRSRRRRGGRSPRARRRAVLGEDLTPCGSRFARFLAASRRSCVIFLRIPKTEAASVSWLGFPYSRRGETALSPAISLAGTPPPLMKERSLCGSLTLVAIAPGTPWRRSSPSPAAAGAGSY